MAKVRKHRTKKPVAAPQGSCARIHGATKILILFFYPSTVGYSQDEESCLLEKLELPKRRRLYEIVGWY
jgi:hypothetical protein